MSANPTLTILGADYEFTLHVDGTWQGIDCRYRPSDLPTIYARILNHEPFEASEFSLSNFTMMRDRGMTHMVAIPVFVNRAFRHGIIWVRRDSDLTEPAQLRGKRIGVQDYTMTAAVWLRGTLIDDYDLHWSELDWYAHKKQRFAAPGKAGLTLVEDDTEAMLLDGRLDAYISPRPKDLARPLGERRLRPLIADAEAVERDYFLRTGIYPINHCMVIHRNVYDRQPEVARAIFEAYAHSKKVALQRKVGSTFVPWGAEYWAQTMSVFGGDPFPFGLDDSNRHNVGTLVGYLYEQGLIARKPEVEELFQPETLDWRE
jgi:4,5-dihydroxyphthalate decarboxylase